MSLNVEIYCVGNMKLASDAPPPLSISICGKLFKHLYIWPLISQDAKLEQILMNLSCFVQCGSSGSFPLLWQILQFSLYQLLRKRLIF